MHAQAHHHIEPLDARYREVRKVTLVGSFIDLLLGILKVVIGFLAHSQALIADGIHSFSDLFTDFLVLFAAKHAHRKADTEHPYGHGRIETVATVALGAVLLSVAAGISYDAIRRMMAPELLLHPGVLALLAALASVLAKEAVYQYTARVARRLHSRMLHANAWHSRSDAISSVVVVIGVGGTMAGLPWLDAVAAIVVALMVAKIAWDLLWKSLQELIDTALDAEQVEAISDSIHDVPGVRALHMLRTRRSGSDALVDVHIQVDPALSVSEGHQIGERVRSRLLENIDEVTDVTVHIDPEDDELSSPCTDLPLRDEILQRLERRWQALDPAPAVDRVVLHYLDGRVHVDVYLPMTGGTDRQREAYSRAIIEAAGEAEDIGKVQVFYT